MNSVKPPPQGWGRDALTSFLHLAYENQWATFVNLPVDFAKLSEIDAVYAACSDDWKDPKDHLAALMLIRSHAAYRAACGLSLSCQTGEVFAIARVCLEYAGYALRIAREDGAAEIWLRRHDDERARKKAKGAFSHESVRRTLAAADRNLVASYAELYDSCIDFGAHPNEKALTSNLRIDKTAQEIRYDALFLNANLSSIHHSMLMLTRIGVCSLCIFEIIFPDRLSVGPTRDRLISLRQELEGAIQP